MRLNDYQRQLLWNASSKNVANRNLSPLAISRKIDEVVAKLHEENPTAFITTAHEGLDGEIYFKGIDGILRDRMFYDEPLSIRRDAYKSFIKKMK